jgi:hypothetical protein
MGAVLRFIAWVFSQAWRLGTVVVGRVVAWARTYWSRVQAWIERGVAWGTILQWIMQILGLA